ncbi:MAG TPA: chloride channel protein [Puia sp.]|uniref:chloride channel protein n=1 Tax=Puia sp. TaxID=2045100 RepID=UPI002D09E55C|nr:chloride channel protein [Puia sp.]HVU93679.1 chloride channel protein [Puia sp.]
MPFNLPRRPDWPALQRTLRWSILILGPAAVTAILTAILLKLVDVEQRFRFSHPWLILLLPAGALVIYFFQRPYPQKAGPMALPGLHDIRSGLSRYSIPFIYCSTLLTQFLGGSAGREGGSFQAASGIGQQFAGWYSSEAVSKGVVVSGSIASAFGVLFGTPVAAAFFALELLRAEKLPYSALVPCIVGGFTGIGISSFFGTMPSQFKYLFTHTLGMNVNGPFQPDLRLALATAGLAVLLGLLYCAFTEATRQIRYLTSRHVRPGWLSPVLMALVLAALGYFSPVNEYLGLGILPSSANAPSILTAFQSGPIDSFGWLWKLLLTLLTLAAGFRGGEIVPLLFIASCLAHVLAPLAGISVSVIVPIAFVAIFAAAANTPLAGIFLGVELFGSRYIVYFALGCLIAYFFSPPTKTPHRLIIRGIPKLLLRQTHPETEPNQ